MNYGQALRYLYSFLNYELRTDYSYSRDLNLERMAWLMDLFGHPEAAGSFVLVGGTKGKGSTAALLASILKEAGWRTGLYTSPHLVSPVERIQVDGSPISEEDFASLAGELREGVGRAALPDFGSLTFFEMFTTAALIYFARAEVDCAVLEVGLGGRLDATSIVSPAVSLLTPVSHDHMDKLGNTLEKIVSEKLPIVKEGCAFVSGRQVARVRTAAARWAAGKKVRVFHYGRDYAPRVRGLSLAGSRFDLRLGAERLRDLEVGLPGRFQVENAACAVQAARALAEKAGRVLDEGAIRRGLARVRFPGRFQVLRGRPPVVLDGAHNGASMRALKESLSILFPARRFAVILAVAKDKDIPRILRELARIPLTRLIITEFASPRALPARDLASRARAVACATETAAGVKEALARAFEVCRGGEAILVTGSLFLVGEALTLLARHPGLRPAPEPETMVHA